MPAKHRVHHGSGSGGTGSGPGTGIQARAPGTARVRAYQPPSSPGPGTSPHLVPVPSPPGPGTLGFRPNTLVLGQILVFGQIHCFWPNTPFWLLPGPPFGCCPDPLWPPPTTLLATTVATVVATMATHSLVHHRPDSPLLGTTCAPH